MKTINKASIIIPTYNRADYLDLTLQSVKNQVTDLGEIEVIVADDGSNDHTASVVKKHEKLLNLKYLFQKDFGNRTAAARNLGILNSDGEIMVFVDCGVILKTDCVHEHILAHISSPEEVAVIGYVYGFDQLATNIDDLPSYLNVHNVDGSIGKLNQLGIFKDMRDILYKKKGFQINEMPAPWALFITCNCSVGRATLDRVGNFDTNLDLNWGVEDLELGYRIWKNGSKFIVAKKAIAVHYPHDSNMSQKFEEEKVNKEYFHKKHNSKATKLFLNCSFLELNEQLIDNKDNSFV